MIRPLHPEDGPALFRLFGQPTPLTCDYFDPGADLASFQTFAQGPAGDHHRLVAIGEEGLLGLGILELPSKARMAHLGKIRLLMPPETLVSDTGDDLLAALLDLADNWLNLRRVEVNVPTGASAVERSLRRFGFEVEGVKRSSLGPGPTFGDEIALARLRGFVDEVDAKRPPLVAPERAKPGRTLTSAIIRPMLSDDSDMLYEIFRAPENCRTTLQLPSQELWLTRQRVLDPPAGMIRLVATRDNRIIGMISLRPRQRRCREHIGGIGMMVHPDFWGLGVGSRLMEALLDRAEKSLNLARIELEVHTDNPAGIRLYEKFGFVIEGTKRFHSYGGGGWSDTYFMARLIS